MFEITIKNLETGEVKETIENEQYLVLAFSDKDDVPDTVDWEGSIENAANAMVPNGHVRAACRLAIAKFEAYNDVKKEKTSAMLKELTQAMERD